MSEELQTAGRVVVGTDISQRAAKAVEWAAQRAEELDLPLLIVTAVPETLPANRSTVIELSMVEHDYVEKSRRRVGERFDELIEKLVDKHPNLSIEHQLLVGAPSYVLAHASRDAALVVVGARGRSAPLKVRFLGGVADQVVTHSHGPVVVIPEETVERPDEPVAVGVDESAESRLASEFAFQSAARRGVPVIAVNAWDFSFYDVYTPALWDNNGDDISDQLKDMVIKETAQLRAEYPDVPVQIKIIRARPEIALVEESKQASLVVVGSRGRGGFAGLLLGSTSKHVLRESHCPVIVTRRHSTGGAII